jgi:hypothetical protein
MLITRPDRSKAEFRALRETVGMTQQHMARLLNVEVRSVKRWESPGYSTYHAPQDAWDILDDAIAAQRRAVSFALGKVDEIAASAGHDPATVELTYWTSQEDYATYHSIEDGGDWRQANANSRLVAFALHERGIEVRWIAGAESKVPKTL